MLDLLSDSSLRVRVHCDRNGMLRGRDKDNQEMDLEVHFFMSFEDQKPSWGKNLGCVRKRREVFEL